MDIVAALTLGFVGSMHCIGMCGPLVLAIPSTARSRWKFIVERIIYHLGRVITYSVFGAVLGMAGKGLLINVQQDVSIILGVMILLTVALPLGLKSRWERISPLRSVYLFVKNKFSVLLLKRGQLALFSLGMLNGLLPCGLVYTALVGATALADIRQSTIFMALFGLGTIPALVVVGISGKLIAQKYRLIFSKAVPLFSILLAIILILRGLNLGIPLLSPKVSHMNVQTETQVNVDCCE